MEASTTSAFSFPYINFAQGSHHVCQENSHSGRTETGTPKLHRRRTFQMQTLDEDIFTVLNQGLEDTARETRKIHPRAKPKSKTTPPSTEETTLAANSVCMDKREHVLQEKRDQNKGKATRKKKQELITPSSDFSMYPTEAKVLTKRIPRTEGLNAPQLRYIEPAGCQITSVASDGIRADAVQRCSQDGSHVSSPRSVPRSRKSWQACATARTGGFCSQDEKVFQVTSVLNKNETVEHDLESNEDVKKKNRMKKMKQEKEAKEKEKDKEKEEREVICKEPVTWQTKIQENGKKKGGHSTPWRNVRPATSEEVSSLIQRLTQGHATGANLLSGLLYLPAPPRRPKAFP